MENGFDRDDSSLYSKHGARLRTISLNDMKADLQKALTPLQLDENDHTFYEARSASRQLEFVNLAVSFDVQINQLRRTQHNLVEATLNLLLLDDDYRVVSSHHGHMRPNGIIAIDPILIRSPQNPRRTDDKLKRAYLVNMDDTTFEPLLCARDSITNHMDQAMFA